MALAVPSCDEAERGLASIALNHPNEFLHASMEARLSPTDFANPLCKMTVEVVLEQTARNASCDLRIEQPTSDLIAGLSMKVDALMRETVPPKAMDTKSLLIDAAKRYQEGDDSSMRISTGFKKIDDICPIRYGDYVVIGGETKSGKTMLALNIISNLLSK
jgi:F0F1-type ATP synthase beta subunit